MDGAHQHHQGAALLGERLLQLRVAGGSLRRRQMLAIRGVVELPAFFVDVFFQVARRLREPFEQGRLDRARCAAMDDNRPRRGRCPLAAGFGSVVA